MQSQIIQTDRLDYRKNCLDTVRLVAAISVFYIHAIRHLQVQMPVLISQIIAFFQGVPIFFAMSGYLVWDSVTRSQNLGTYAKKRFLRIYPELWCAVLLNTAVILLLYKAPIPWGQFGLFTLTQSTMLQFWTPDFLRGYGCGTPNGSLWTICVTVQFYIVIFFIYKLLKNRRLCFWLVLLATAVFVRLLSPLLAKVLPTMVYKLYGQTLVPHAWMFILGTMVAAKRELIVPFLKRWWALLFVISAIFKLLRVDIPMGDYRFFCCSALILGVFGFAYQCPKWNIPVDISYGVYIYHMIVVNAMVQLGFTEKPIHILIALVITVMLSLLSERTVGRMAMLLKNRL